MLYLAGAKFNTCTKVIAATYHDTKTRTEDDVSVCGGNDLKHSAFWKLHTVHTSERANGRSCPAQLLTPNRSLLNRETEPDEDEDESATPSGKQESVKAKVVINCAGLYGDDVEKMRGGASATGVEPSSFAPNQFTVVPRKGQFIVFKPIQPSSDVSSLSPEIVIEPVATEFTKGVIAWKTGCETNVRK